MDDGIGIDFRAASNFSMKKLTCSLVIFSGGKILITFGLEEEPVKIFSSKSKWFKSYLEGKEGFREFAIQVDPTSDLSQVTRPRSLPLLS